MCIENELVSGHCFVGKNQHSVGGGHMGRLVNGEWSTEWYETKRRRVRLYDPIQCFSGLWPMTVHFRRWRADTTFMSRWHVHGPTERGACIKGLEGILPVSVVNPLMYDDGWSFLPGDGVDVDPNEQVQFLRELYCIADAQYTGRVTVYPLGHRHERL